MCLFCDIIEGKIPSYTLYEDDIVKCFLDLNQSCLGHMLIVPKVHIDDVDSIDDETLTYVFKIAKKMKKTIEDKLRADGITYEINYGIAQEIKHFHLHIMPKYKNEKENMELDKLYEILKED